MTSTRLERAADSPFLERVTYVEYEEDTRELTTPDGCWDIDVRTLSAVTPLWTF
jgi:hypothetical protein